MYYRTYYEHTKFTDRFEAFLAGGPDGTTN